MHKLSYPRPIPGETLVTLRGGGEIFAARPADPFERDEGVAYFIVYKSSRPAELEPSYRVAILNRWNGLHAVAAYADCGEAFSDYFGRELVPACP